MTAEALNATNCSTYRSFAVNLRGNRPQSRWAIVLAGGDGIRMRSLISDWLGEERPKQYCTFVGSRSMLQHAIDRARCVVSEDHVVTVIGWGHRKYLSMSTDGSLSGLVLEQPRNLGTGPGIFLAIAYVIAADPEATVVLLPSDHFVYPESRFCGYVKHAFELAEKYVESLILVAAIPDRPETEYGWVDPTEIQTSGDIPFSYGLTNVVNFREKPGVNEALRLLQQGSLWSTMVVAVKAQNLWNLSRQFLPEIVGRFDAFVAVLRAVREGRLDASYEAAALMRLYKDLPPADFSKDILQRVAHLSMVLRMDGVDWCDWGSPRRVTETLARLGQRPLFDPERFGLTQTIMMADEKRDNLT